VKQSKTTNMNELELTDQELHTIEFALKNRLDLLESKKEYCTIESLNWFYNTEISNVKNLAKKLNIKLESL
jgi:hypothetical protein